MTAMHTVTSLLQNNATANWASNNNVCCLLKRILTYACVTRTCRNQCTCSMVVMFRCLSTSWKGDKTVAKFQCESKARLWILRDQHIIEKYKVQTNLFWSNFYQSWTTPTTSGLNNESLQSPAAVFNQMHLHIWCHLQDPSIDGCGYTVQIVSLWSLQAVFFLDLECCWMWICIFT